MKLFKLFFILAIAIFGVSLTTISAQTNAFGRNRTEGIDKKIRKEIMQLPYYGVFDAISFSVSNGVVYLTGSVVQPTTKQDAQRSIARIAGVAEVINKIEVLPLSNFDDQIRNGIVRQFERGGSLYRYLQGVNPSMRIIVKNGNVSLEGYVSSQGDSNLANILTRSVFGVFSVQNNLIIEKGS